MTKRNVGRPPKNERASHCCMVRFTDTEFARLNYNQTVVALKSNFTEKKAFAMLTKLEKLTLELAIIGGEIVQLTREFQEKWQHRQ